VRGANSRVKGSAGERAGRERAGERRRVPGMPAAEEETADGQSRTCCLACWKGERKCAEQVQAMPTLLYSLSSIRDAIDQISDPLPNHLT